MSTLAETLACQTPHTVGEWSHALDIVEYDRILVDALMDFSRCGWQPVAAALTLHKALNTPITEPLMVRGQL